MSDLVSEDVRRLRQSAFWFAAGALLIDCLTLAVSVGVPHLTLATDLRRSFPALDARCLTWTFWAPLALAVVSLVSIPLAFRAEFYEIPRSSATRRLVGVARVLSIGTPLAWSLTAVAVAYVDPRVCAYRWEAFD